MQRMKLYKCTLIFCILFYFFYEIAEVYFSILIKCIDVQFNFLHLEKIFLCSVNISVWKINEPLNLLCKCFIRYK